ncbi:hypothetical protein Tco_0325696, partial [Tanacetum coccineum]
KIPCAMLISYYVAPCVSALAGCDTYASREAWAHSIGLIQTQHEVHETRFQMQEAELAALQETDRRRQDQMQRRARQPGPETRIPDHQDASEDADSHI